jgi:hypothetical protein
MIRQRLLWRVLGRRLVERLLRAGWIKPARVSGHRIFYDQLEVHQALRRLQREGHLIDGHVRSRKVRKPTDPFENFSLGDLTGP